jgi:AcrR family transcriptional regulator
MVRKPKQERSKATVEAIIKAAAICVGENGYGGTSLRKIADTAGVGVGSIYEYFEDKEMIYQAMYEEVLSDTVNLVNELIPELVKLDTNAAITELLFRFRTFAKQDNELYLKVFQQSVGRDIKITSQPLEDILSKFVMQYILQHPEVSQIKNIPAISYILINGGIPVVLKHISDPNPAISFEELANTFGDILTSFGEFHLKHKR